MSWVLTKGLTSWRSEINAVFPKRDKESDGSIGDTIHAQGVSGHNNENSGHAEFNDFDGLDEVRAIDVDKDLKNPKFSMEQLIQWLVTLGRAGTYLPFRYFIYNKRIWAKSTGWKTRTYTGPNPHDHHAHFSGDYTQKADNWTGKLGLLAYVLKVTGSSASTKGPTKVTHQYFNAHLPVIPYGHDDRDGIVGTDGKKDEAWYVKRFQSVHGLDADGIYGNQTRDKIKSLVKGHNGMQIDLPVWVVTFALWGAKLTEQK